MLGVVHLHEAVNGVRGKQQTLSSLYILSVEAEVHLAEDATPSAQGQQYPQHHRQAGAGKIFCPQASAWCLYKAYTTEDGIKSTSKAWWR